MREPSNRDRRIIEEEIAAEVKERRGEESDFEILKGYIGDLEKEFGIVIPEPIEDRLRFLEKNARMHNRDARVIYAALGEMYQVIRARKIQFRSGEERRKWEGHFSIFSKLTREDWGVLLAAALVHDIGKSGPPRVSKGEAGRVKFTRRQEMASRLYNLELLPNGRGTSIKEALEMIIRESGQLGAGEGAVEKLQSYLIELRNMGLSPREFIPRFWQLHTEWGAAILKKHFDQTNPVYQRIIRIASSHHYFEGTNPENVALQAENLSEEERRDALLIKLLIVLDQYQGSRRRGKRNPAAASDYFKTKLESKGFADDPEFVAILDLIKKVEETSAVFSLGAGIEAEMKK